MLDVNRLRVIDAVARHGSVTAAAKELHYSQPSVTHHLARLEAETGAQLLQRVGRGIRLTAAGELLADRAAEILGRIDAAGAELSAHVGLTAGRVRLAGFASAIGSLVPGAVATLAARHPNLQITLTDTHPPEAIELLRTGKIDVAVIFRYDETDPEPPGVRLHHLLDGVVATELPGWERHISAATYGQPPDPPATAALLAALAEAATSATSPAVTSPSRASASRRAARSSWTCP